MSKTIEDKGLSVNLFKGELVEIEHEKFRDVSIQVKVADPTSPLTPPGALYLIQIYKSTEKSKVMPFGYGRVYVMSNGVLLNNGKEYSEYMKKHKK